LLRNADSAMYRAKKGAKACYEVLEPSMHERPLERLKLENDLRGTIERGQLRVYYQPEVRLESGKVFAMEALVRWEHPKRGLILPSKFMPIAEENSLVTSIGRWVLKDSCRGDAGGITSTRVVRPFQYA
jgi:predicted signal transduction protein with EAL and GGDEF domain